jgi:hypothetical protein
MIYDGIWDLFTEVFRNVGFFIQVPVGSFCSGVNLPLMSAACFAIIPNVILAIKKGAGFPAPLLVEIDLF